MAYNKTTLYNKAKEIIKTKKPIFIEELISFMGIDKTTFYRHFPVDSNEINEIKELINYNIVNDKQCKLQTQRKHKKSKRIDRKVDDYIYIIQTTGTNYYKIGISSTQWNHRKAALQTGNPFKIIDIFVYETEYAANLENKLHIKLHKYNVQGEWFDLNEEQIDDIKNYIYEFTATNSQTELWVQK